MPGNKSNLKALQVPNELGYQTGGEALYLILIWELTTGCCSEITRSKRGQVCSLLPGHWGAQESAVCKGHLNVQFPTAGLLCHWVVAGGSIHPGYSNLPNCKGGCSEPEHSIIQPDLPCIRLHHGAGSTVQGPTTVSARGEGLMSLAKISPLLDMA